MSNSSTRLLAILVLGAALGACSGSNAPSPPVDAAAQQAAAADAQANKELDMYRSLLASHSYELALPIGQELVARFPQTAAASEVRATLADTERDAKAASEKRRLERLWSYQSGPESGGSQNTASIYSSQPAAADQRIRLVLRRHSEWGQSVYLFGSGKGFACASPCRVEAWFDDQPQRLKASLPKTGEPALFIEDDKAFIARLGKVQKIRFEVSLKGDGKRSVMFEVGGFDAAKFPPLGKK